MFKWTQYNTIILNPLYNQAETTNPSVFGGGFLTGLVSDVYEGLY